MILFNSDRLNFYQLSEQYFEEFCQMDMDPDVMEFYTSRPHGTREAALQSFKRYQDYMKNFPQLGGFMAFAKESNLFIGLGVLIHLELNPANDRYEVGYRLPKYAWGQGYASEICKTLINYGFEALKFDEIYGTTNPSHLVSQKVLMKCGLQNIGSTPNYGGSTLFKISRPEN